MPVGARRVQDARCLGRQRADDIAGGLGNLSCDGGLASMAPIVTTTPPPEPIPVAVPLAKVPQTPDAPRVTRHAVPQTQKPPQPRFALPLPGFVISSQRSAPNITAHSAKIMMSSRWWSLRPTTRGSGRSAKHPPNPHASPRPRPRPPKIGSRRLFKPAHSPPLISPWQRTTFYAAAMSAKQKAQMC